MGTLLRAWVAFRGGLWRDEALFVFVASLPTSGATLDFLRQHESHPPLFYFLMRGWLAISRDERWAVVPPLAFGVLLIPAVYLTGRRMYSETCGLLAATLVAASPVLSGHAALVRPYSFLELLSVAGVYHLWRGLQGSRRAWLWYGLVMLSMLLTHNWTWVVLGAHVLFVLLALAFSPTIRRHAAQGWFVSQIGIGVGYLPWLPVLLHQSRHAGYPGVPYLRLGLFWEFTPAISGLPLPILLLLAVMLGIGVLPKARVPAELPRLGEHRNVVDRRGRILALALCAWIPIAAAALATSLSFTSNLMVAHCFGIVTPIVLLLIAQAIALTLERGRRRLAWAAVLGVLCVHAYSWWASRTYVKSNARELAATVAARLSPKDLIVISPEWLASSFNFYFHGANAQIDFPSFGRLEVVRFDDRFARLTDPVSLTSVTDSLKAWRARYDRVWLILESQALRETADSPKAISRGPNYYVRFTRLRSKQLRDSLQSLYGVPEYVSPAKGVKVGTEILMALLFDRASPAGP